MNILFFAPYFYPYVSGMTTYPLAVFSALAPKHHINVQTFAHARGLAKSELYKGIRITRMPFLLRVSKGFLSPYSLFLFFRSISQADAVVVNLPSVEGLPLVLLARFFHKPVVAFFYCEVVLRASLFERSAAWVLNTLTRIQLSLCTKIVALSHDYVDSLGWSQAMRQKVKIVPPPIQVLETEATYEKKLQAIKANSVLIGFAGRVSREKGLAVLAEALPLVKTNKRIHFICAGPYGADVAGEAEYFSQLKRELHTHKIQHTFLGSLSGGKLGAFYRTIDVLVLPSINKTEAMGMVQLEAMLVGTPVVASNLPGVRQPVVQTGMGEIAAIGDARDLAAKISLVLNKPHTYRTTIKKAKAKKIYGSGTTADAIERILQDSLSAS